MSVAIRVEYLSKNTSWSIRPAMDVIGAFRQIREDESGNAKKEEFSIERCLFEIQQENESESSGEKWSGKVHTAENFEQDYWSNRRQSFDQKEG